MTFQFRRDLVSNINSTYGKTARFDGTGRAMTEDEIRSVAPSVFAETAHESRSERFRPIPTIEAIRGLAKEGFVVVGALQSGARDASKKAFTKHLLRIRHVDDVAKMHTVGGVVAEMLLRNANDGSSAYDLYSGLFRTICLNSLVAAMSEIESLKVRHSGDVVGKVIEGTYKVVDQSRLALAAPEAWSQIQLDRDEQHAFAAAAHTVRFADAEGHTTTPVQPAQLLLPRRNEDRANDLWTTFNRVQENAIRGGLTGTARNANGQLRRGTTRQIGGIDQLTAVNRGLWMLTDRMAQLKGGAPIAA